MIRPFDEDCGELTREEMRTQRCDFGQGYRPDYENAADRSARKTAALKERAFIKAQVSDMRAYGIDDRALVVDENFWRGMKVALGFTVVMASLLGLIAYRLFS